MRHLLMACIVGAGTLMASAVPVSAAAPGANGRIAFTRDGAIWTMNADGTDERQLTTPVGEASDVSPAWSPGGTMIAYTHSSGGFAADVWLMQADGARQRPWITSSRPDASPSWSPDARYIAFDTDRNATQRTLTGEFYTDVWVHGASNASVNRVTRLEPTRRHAYRSAWSPNLTTIAFTTYGETGPNGIATKEVPKGTWFGCLCPVTVVAEHDGGGYGADWSPDGATIAYAVDGDLWTVTPPAAPVPITFGSAQDREPAWSPDGTRLVFQRDGVLHLADGDGSNLVSLGVTGGEPAWQPLPGEPFVDARFSTFEEHIVWARMQGLTAGCAPERFCPGHVVTRAVAASFVADALELPATSVDAFVDDEGSTHEDDINRIAAAGITTGCGRTSFCPNKVLTRELLAPWLARAFDLPPTDVDYFGDDEDSPHEWAINRVAEAGIVTGVAPGRYLGVNAVRRGELVTMLHRALD